MTSRRTDRVRVHAPAKINLTLRVLGVRLDGYHELRTTFQSLELHDTLTFTKIRGSFEIECDDPQCPTDRANLVWRAAEALWRARGRRGEVSGARVRIRKRIPMQAGLGGGSSDAAATLTALTALWDAPVSGGRRAVLPRRRNRPGRRTGRRAVPVD
jgi:4-diphosphocytidyl-2-C-methyl-D-erythritol kinase